MNPSDAVEFDHKRYQKTRILTLIGQIEELTGKSLQHLHDVNQKCVDYYEGRLNADALILFLDRRFDELEEGL